MTITGKRQLARLTGLVVANAAFFDVASARLGVNDSHTSQDILPSSLLKRRLRWRFGTPFGVPQGVPPTVLCSGRPRKSKAIVEAIGIFISERRGRSPPDQSVLDTGDTAAVS